MRTLEMKIVIPEVKGGRCVSVKMKDGYILANFEIEEDSKKLECRIDPSRFKGKWIEYYPVTYKQKELLSLYQEANAKGRLHAFTCMTIDPSIIKGKIVYQKGLPPAVGIYQKQWVKKFKNYNPSRNSRQMTRTEFACRNLFIIERLVESGYKIEDAWATVCDDSKKIGHYCNSDNAKLDFEPTGSREICGFCDLANTAKLIAKDSQDDLDNSFYYASSNFENYSDDSPIALTHLEYDLDKLPYDSVGILALD